LLSANTAEPDYIAITHGKNRPHSLGLAIFICGINLINSGTPVKITKTTIPTSELNRQVIDKENPSQTLSGKYA